MKERKISIAFQTNKTSSYYINLAKYVNQFEFDMVSVYCDAPYHPSYGPLLLMAPHIKRAKIGPAAVSPYRIHPLDIAANTALLGQVANGGVYIGLARGAWLSEHGIQEPSRPLRGIEEAALIIRNLLAGGTAGMDGEIFRIAEYVRAPYPLPETIPPLLIGTWGPKLAELAGKIADEVKIGGSANPDVAPVLLSKIQKGERKAKRPQYSVGLVMGAVTVVDDDRELAREFAKKSLAMYLPVVASLDPTISLDPELINRVELLVNQGETGKASMHISDDLLDFFAFAGNPDDLIRHSERLFAAGVTRIEFGTPHGLSSESGIRLLGERVIPAIKKL